MAALPFLPLLLSSKKKSVSERNSYRLLDYGCRLLLIGVVTTEALVLSLVQRWPVTVDIGEPRFCLLSKQPRHLSSWDRVNQADGNPQSNRLTRPGLQDDNLNKVLVLDSG